MSRKVLKQFFQENKLATLLILVGSAIWSLTMVKSGLVYDFGMGFWGANGHDGVWHIALIHQLADGQFVMPIFSGEPLRNYHFLFDLLVAGVHRLTLIPVVNLYFQIIPPTIAILVGLFTYKFVLMWRKEKSEAFWATFFVYFGGGWGWFVTLIRSGDIGGESMFWSQQAITTLINPPFALSLVILMAGFVFALKYFDKPSLRNFLITSILFGILLQTKAYGGALVLGALLVSGVYEYVRVKSLKVMKLFIGSLVISLFVFLPFNKTGASLFIYQPFWFLETLMSASDRFNWQKMAEAMLSYKNQDVISKFIPAYGLAFLLFVFGNLGTRVLGVYQKVRDLFSGKLVWVSTTLAAIIVAGFLIPMVFLQKGTPWNTIQFTYYSLFFMGIFAGISLPNLVKRFGKTGGGLFLIAVILLTLPTTYGALGNYLPKRPPAAIPKDELAALEFLSERDDGVVLTYPIQRARLLATSSNPPRPLYLYTSTAYVSAFSEKQVFLENQGNVQILGYDPEERLGEIYAFLDTKDEEEARGFLEKRNIRYIYWIKGQRATLGETQLGIERIFENETVDIYEVTK